MFYNLQVTLIGCQSYYTCLFEEEYTNFSSKILKIGILGQLLGITQIITEISKK